MLDSTGPFDYHFSRRLIALCDEHGVPHRRDTFRYYRSDAASAVEAGLEMRTALVGFGVDSFVESLSGGALLWRLRSDENSERREKIALKLVGILLATRFMQEGRMPNFQRLAERGVFRPLDTSNPSIDGAGSSLPSGARGSRNVTYAPRTRRSVVAHHARFQPTSRPAPR